MSALGPFSSILKDCARIYISNRFSARVFGHLLRNPTFSVKLLAKDGGERDPRLCAGIIHWSDWRVYT